jgi:hypothetical protein
MDEGDYASPDPSTDETSAPDDPSTDQTTMPDDSGYDENQGGTVEFPDGSTVTDPYQDEEGNVYQTQQDWIDGTNPYDASTPPDSSDTYEATPEG